jgi:hypothetical protein
VGVGLGWIGALLPPGNAQYLLWALSSYCIIVGATLLGSKLTREDHDIPAAGFIILGIGNAMIYAFIATHDVGSHQFGAGIMIYSPGLLLISMYDRSHALLPRVGLSLRGRFRRIGHPYFPRGRHQPRGTLAAAAGLQHHERSACLVVDPASARKGLIHERDDQERERRSWRSAARLHRSCLHLVPATLERWPDHRLGLLP